MQSDEYKVHLTNKLITEFQNNFLNKIGLMPVITFEITAKRGPNVPQLSLEQVVEYLNTKIPWGFRNKGITHIKEKSRKRLFVDLRMIFYKIATDSGYSQEQIGKFLNYDHTTVCNALRQFPDFVTTDENFRKLYNDCLLSIQLKTNYESPLLCAA